MTRDKEAWKRLREDFQYLEWIGFKSTLSTSRARYWQRDYLESVELVPSGWRYLRRDSLQEEWSLVAEDQTARQLLAHLPAGHRALTKKERDRKRLTPREEFHERLRKTQGIIIGRGQITSRDESLPTADDVMRWRENRAR